MSRLPTIPSAYQGRSKAQETQRLINLFPELANAPGSKSISALIGTAGLRLFSNGVASPVRGAITGPDGLLYVVESNKFLQVAADGTASSALGSLTTSTGRVSMSQNGLLSAGIGGNQIMIVDGTNGYVYNVVSKVFTTINSIPAVQAVAVAVNTGAAIASVTINNPGTGYTTAPTASVTGGPGTGAVLSVQWGWSILSIVLNNPCAITGTPVLTFADPTGYGATATPVVSGGYLTGIIMASKGAGYTNPIITATNLVQGTSQLNVTIAFDTSIYGIIGVTVVSGGSGYINPVVTFTGGGTGTVTTAVAAETITEINVTTGGSGYTSTPSVTVIDNGVTPPTTPLTITNISIVNTTMQSISLTGGVGYTATPTIVISAPQGSTFPSTPQQIEFIDSYFIVTNGSMSTYASAIYDGTIFPTLATTPVEAAPDNISTPLNLHQQLFFIKQYTSEVYYNNGTAVSDGFPYSRLSGAIIDYGTLAPWTVCRGNNSALFLAWERDTDNNPCFAGVVELSGYVPTVVSPQSITWMIQQSTDLTQCFAYCYSSEGHTFYVLTNPVDNWTLVYDATNQTWHERSTNVTATSAVTRHLSNIYIRAYGLDLVGDYLSGRIYEMSTKFFTDAGLPITCTHITQHLDDEESLDDVFIGELQIDVETGVGLDGPATPAIATSALAGGVVASVTVSYGGADYIGTAIAIFESVDGNGSGAVGTVQIAYGSVAGVTVISGGIGYTQAPSVTIVGQPVQPVAGLSISRDGGNTWGNEHLRSMGQPGQYRRRLVYRSLGHARDRVFRIRSSSPCKRVILGYLVEPA